MSERLEEIRKRLGNALEHWNEPATSDDVHYLLERLRLAEQVINCNPTILTAIAGNDIDQWRTFIGREEGK